VQWKNISKVIGTRGSGVTLSRRTQGGTKTQRYFTEGFMRSIYPKAVRALRSASITCPTNAPCGKTFPVGAPPTLFNQPSPHQSRVWKVWKVVVDQFHLSSIVLESSMEQQGRSTLLPVSRKARPAAAPNHDLG